MKRLSTLAIITSLTLFAGCSMTGDRSAGQLSDTSEDVQPALAAAPESGKRITPSMTAPVEVVKRMKHDPSRVVRVEGDHAIYAGTAAVPVEMTALPEVAAVVSRSARSAAVRVSGGARIESPWPDARVDAAIQAAMTSAPGEGMQMMHSAGGKKGPRLKTNFDAIGAEDCCVDPVPFTATVPPDPDMAVGPDHIIVVVNVTFAIYDKRGNVLQPPTAFSEFFAGVDPACGPGGPFDPDVVYDESSGQFILGVDGNGTDYCIAATVNGDPLGQWNRFAFPADINGEFFDFPHMGVGVDALYVGSNQFAPVFDNDGNFLGFAFAGGRVFAVNKDDLFSGDPLRVVQRLVPRFDSTPQPAQLHGANTGNFPTSSPDYIMTEVFDGINHSVYAWTDPFGVDIFSHASVTSISPPPRVYPAPAFPVFPLP